MGETFGSTPRSHRVVGLVVWPRLAGNGSCRF